MKDPVRGSATVVSSSQAASNVMYAPLHMNLVVQAEGMAPTSVEYRQRAARTKRFPFPGQVIPVEVDRSDPTRVEVLWDEVPTRDEHLRRQADTMAAGMGAQGTVAPTGGPLPPQVAGIVDQLQQSFPGARITTAGAGAGGAADPVGEDRLVALERLADLRDRGVLSAEEFEREKARLLGGG
jgi:hypothetical protein